MSHPEPAPRRIPALWIVIGVPLATVLASILTVTLAFRGAEPELPSQYSWEGAALDQDLAQAQRARELGAGLDLRFGSAGQVVADLRLGAAQERRPAQLRLQATHATRPELDRAWTLSRGPDGLYRGAGAALGTGPWLLQLSADDWRLRGRLELRDRGTHLGSATP